MGVVSVHEKTEGQRAPKGPGRGYTRVFLVELDDVTDGARAARRADDGEVSIPEIGDPHPLDTRAKARRITPQMHEDRLHWIVKVDYETPKRDPGGGGTGIEEDPLNDPVQISWGGVPYTEVVAFDTARNPIVNSAFDPFDPPLEQEEQRSEVTVVRNEASFNAGQADAYRNTVNSVACTIVGCPVKPKQALLAEYSARRAERNGIAYWAVTYRVQFRLIKRDGSLDHWFREVLDAGYYAFEMGTEESPRQGKHDKIRIGGKEVTEPKRLNGYGEALFPDDAPLSDSVYLPFETYRMRDFSAPNGGLRLNI